MNPVVQLKHSDPTAFNYAYIADFKRYYFINDIRYDSGLWILSLNVDVLATYKTTIGSTSGYITRSASAGNGYIPDRAWPLTGKTSCSQVGPDGGASYATTYASGVFVLACTGSTDVNGITLYQMSASTFKSFISTLFTTADGYKPGDVAQGIFNSLVNPLDYISSCMWFPSGFTTSGQSTYIDLGLWPTPFAADIISTSSYSDVSISFTVPKHPQASTYGKYCNLAPYSDYVLDLGFIPTIHLDSTMLVDAATINILVKRDPLTGMAVVTGESVNALTGNQPLFTVTCQYGVPIALTQTTANITGLVNNMLVTGADIVSANPRVALDAVAMIGEVTEAMTGNVTSAGNTGSIIGHQVTKLLSGRFFEIAARDVTNKGKPLCDVRTVSTLSGYMQMENAHVAISGTAAEAGQINSYMESGFYYE